MLRLLTAAAAMVLSAAPCAEAETLEVVGDRLFIAARVNSIPVSALLDSAAEISIADKAWAMQNGIDAGGAETVKGTGGETEAAFAENIVVETLGATLPNMTVAVLDLSDIAERLIGRPTPFIMGRELFDRERLVIDIEDKSIEIASPGAAPSGVALSLVSERGVETIEAVVNGETVRAEFDLGNGSEVLISRAFAERLGLLANPEALETRKGGGIGGAVERRIVRLQTLEIAGEEFTKVEAAVDETDNAGALNLGVRLLRNFRIVTDFEERTIWLERR